MSLGQPEREAVRPEHECGVCGVFDEQDPGDKMEEDGGCQEARKVKKMMDPKLPTQDEIEEHNLTHLPFRNWCRHCIKGRGREMPHMTIKDVDEKKQHEFHMDFCFLGAEHEPGEALTVLIAKERATTMAMATVGPSTSAMRFVNEPGECDLEQSGATLRAAEGGGK